MSFMEKYGKNRDIHVILIDGTTYTGVLVNENEDTITLAIDDINKIIFKNKISGVAGA